MRTAWMVTTKGRIPLRVVDDEQLAVGWLRYSSFDRDPQRAALVYEVEEVSQGVYRYIGGYSYSTEPMTLDALMGGPRAEG